MPWVPDFNAMKACAEQRAMVEASEPSETKPQEETKAAQIRRANANGIGTSIPMAPALVAMPLPPLNFR